MERARARTKIGAVRVAVIAVALVWVAACARPGATDPISTNLATVPEELRGYLENVAGAGARRYAVRDDQDHELDGLAILPAPDGGFVGVSHWWSVALGEFRVGLSTSHDLLTWTWQADLARQASMPAIRPASDGGYVVAWEQEPDNHLAFAWYPSWDDLLAARPSKTFEARQRLSDCAEGTPNLLSASSTFVSFGFHYFGDCDLDREARGTMDSVDLDGIEATRLDAAILANGVHGGIGDRDALAFRGREFMVIEAMSVRDDWSTWKVYLVDESLGAEPLSFVTDGGSRAFTNPTASIVEFRGRPTLVATLFVPQEGARGGEAGSLVYYTPIAMK